MALNTKNRVSPPLLIIVSTIMAVICIISGLLAGYFLSSSTRKLTTVHDFSNRILYTGETVSTCSGRTTNDPEVLRFLSKCDYEACKAETCRIPLPRSYIAYHLGDETIDLDGLIEEEAWQQVAWTENFVDIRGTDYPQPQFQTRTKVRWDDTHLYIAAYMESTDVWANKTLHDTTVYRDNAFQFVVDTEGSNQKYKEIVINAFGTVSDLMLSKPYLDDGEPLTLWESGLKRAVYIDGPLNDPKQPNTFWSVEMALPFVELVAGTEKNNNPPSDREVWRANFVRSHWKMEVVGDKYIKILDKDADWWVWNSPLVTNIHIPDRWGLLQFRRQAVNSTTFIEDPYWVLQNALIDMYNILQAYKTNNGRFTDRLDRLNVPAYILSGKCVHSPEIQVDWGGFTVTLRPVNPSLLDGHIRTDRYIWYGRLNKV